MTSVLSFAHIADDVFKAVASCVLGGIQDGGVQVLLLLISLPVVQLLITIIKHSVRNLTQHMNNYKV